MSPAGTGFAPVGEVAVTTDAWVYEHGWQSWSPSGCYRATDTSARPTLGWQQTMRFRPQTPAPATGFQAEGLLVVDPGDGSGPVGYVAAAPEGEVPSVRAERHAGTLSVTANGPVEVVRGASGLDAALTGLGDRVAARLGAVVREAPSVWCSWYHYFLDVTEDDIVENLEAMTEHDLAVDVVQVDDGWQAGIGDWQQLSPRFSSTADLAARIRDAGRRAGIWLAPFIVGSGSELAHRHPDWLLGAAGENWDQDLFGLDLSRTDVREYLWEVFDGLRRQGYDYFKLDFLYGGALPGPRQDDRTAVQAYRSGLETIRDAVGPDSHLLGCGAPILPSVGLVDAMRISPDTYNPSDPDNGDDVLRGRPNIEARAWQQGRFWVNDADCLVARPVFARRAEWADVVDRWSGLRSVSDRIRDLDPWALETTRRFLRTRPAPAPFPTLPDLLPR